MYMSHERLDIHPGSSDVGRNKRSEGGSWRRRTSGIFCRSIVEEPSSKSVSLSAQCEQQTASAECNSDSGFEHEGMHRR